MAPSTTMRHLEPNPKGEFAGAGRASAASTSSMAGIGQRLGNFKHAARPAKAFPHSPHSPRQNPGDSEAIIAAYHRSKFWKAGRLGMS
jgi:hypothetical protein